MQGGEWHWYAFKYDFDDSGDSRQAPSNIRLDMKPGAGAELLLLNGDQVRAWEHGEKLQGFGVASPVISSTRVKVDKGEFCEQNPHDPICDDNGNRANSQCENLRDPLSTDSSCNFTLKEPRGYVHLDRHDRRVGHLLHPRPRQLTPSQAPSNTSSPPAAMA